VLVGAHVTVDSGPLAQTSVKSSVIYYRRLPVATCTDII